MPTTLLDTATRGVEAVHQIVAERDQLLNDADRRETALSLYRERIEQLEGRLNQALAERDHYMRYCTEITVKLNDIQMLITTTVEGAKTMAFRSTHVAGRPPPPEISAEDADKLENMVARLAKNGGETPA